MALFQYSTAQFYEHDEKPKSGQPESDPDSNWAPPGHKSDALPMARTCSVLRTHRKHSNIQRKKYVPMCGIKIEVVSYHEH